MSDAEESNEVTVSMVPCDIGETEMQEDWVEIGVPSGDVAKSGRWRKNGNEAKAD